MSIQEKINELALAALRTAPVMSRPQPATFMPPFEKPRQLAIVEAGGPVTDARYRGSSRIDRELALAAAASRWPFHVREVRI